MTILWVSDQCVCLCVLGETTCVCFKTSATNDVSNGEETASQEGHDVSKVPACGCARLKSFSSSFYFLCRSLLFDACTRLARCT